MTVDDVVYSFKSQCDPKSGGTALSVFSGTLGPRRRGKGGDTGDCIPPRGTDGSLPRCRLVRQLQHDHRPERLRLRQLPEGLGRDRALHDVQLHPERRGDLRAQPALLGHTGTSRAGAVDLLPGRGADDRGPRGERDRLSGPVLRFHQPTTVERHLQHHQAEGLRAPRAVDALRHRAFKASTSARRSRSRSTVRARKALFKGYADIGNDNPFAPVLPLDGRPVPQRTQNFKLAKELLAKAG